jgi:hypothetical protein
LRTREEKEEGVEVRAALFGGEGAVHVLRQCSFAFLLQVRLRGKALSSDESKGAGSELYFDQRKEV